MAETAQAADETTSGLRKNVPEPCYSEPFAAVILSEAKNLGISAQGKLREESRSEDKGLARFLVA